MPGPRTLWQALRRGTLGLSGRIVLLSLALLLLVQGAGFVVIRENIDRNAHRQLADRLGLAERVWQHLLEQRASKLSQGAAVLAADYGIREVLGTRDPMRVDIRAQASVGLWVGPAAERVHPLCRADRLPAPAHAVDLRPGRQPAGGDGPAGCAAHLGEPVYPRPDTATCPTSSTPSCAATERRPTASAWSSPRARS